MTPIVLALPADPSRVYTLILDPSEVAEDRTELNLNDGPIRLDQQGIDWGDAAIQQYQAELTVGQTAVDFRLPNRVVTIPLGLGMDDSGLAGFDAARALLSQKVGRLHQEGGWLKRDSNIGPLYADIINATLKEPDRYGQAGAVEPDVVLVLECLPDFYGEVVVLDSAAGTGSLAAVLELASAQAQIAGDHSGRVEIDIADASGNDQLGLLWGLRSRHYSSAPTAALEYEAEDLTPLDAATVVTLTGASGGGTDNAVEHANLASSWTPVLSTDLVAGGSSLTHTGSYRVWARIKTTSDAPPKIRFLYDVGDFTLPEENDASQIPAANSFYIRDLGTVRIDKAPVGSHRWKGVVQARGAAGGENVYIDKLWFQPLDEGAGRLTAASSGITPGVAGYSARSEFGTESGPITGDTAEQGGAWVGFGDATDISAAAGAATRTEINDALFAGRGVVLLVGLSDVAARVDFKASLTGHADQGVVLRYVDPTNWLVAMMLGSNTIAFVQSLGGALTARIGGVASSMVTDTYYTMLATVDSGGHANARVFPQGGVVPIAELSYHDSSLAVGGALASGGAGVYDENDTSSVVTRTYKNFGAWAPDFDAIIFADQSAALRHDVMVREDPTGSAYGPVSKVIGDLPRIPASGAEGRPVELFVLASRGDFDELPDTSRADDLTVQATYRPTYLFRP